MTGNVFTYTWNPLSTDVGTHTWYVTVLVYLSNYIFAYEDTVSFDINVVSCNIVPPTTYTSAVSCYENAACTIATPSAHTFSNNLCASSLNLLFTLTYAATNAAVISQEPMA